MEHFDSHYYMYATDATAHTHGNLQTKIRKPKLQHDGNKTKLWCIQNKMEINYDKTACIPNKKRNAPLRFSHLDLLLIQKC